MDSRNLGQLHHEPGVSQCEATDGARTPETDRQPQGYQVRDRLGDTRDDGKIACP